VDFKLHARSTISSTSHDPEHAKEQHMSVAVITGSSRGLGLALTSALNRRSWDIVVDARHPSELREATEQVRGPGRLVAVAGDVTDPSHVRELAAAAEDLGGADLLVNNASTIGASPLPTIEDLDAELLAHILRTNVVAPVTLVQALLPQLRRRRGRIVNITSDAAVEAYQTWGGYGSSKAALEQITAILAAEQPDLKVHAFDPGDMRTQLQQDASPGQDISALPDPTTVVPALLRLLDEDLPSGRYRARDLLAAEGARA
jgi:NAD(P)-dependent dehydrogenase (short-subunit alcohol dehydrogenase family)